MFKDRLKEARKQAGFSQEKLGVLMGVSKQTISDYERGHSEPDMAKITLAMNALGVDANYLWQDEMEASSHVEISEEALHIARSFDKMSDYGKSLIRCVVENEEDYKVVRRIPIMAEAKLDGSFEAMVAAKNEASELTEAYPAFSDIEDAIIPPAPNMKKIIEDYLNPNN